MIAAAAYKKHGNPLQFSKAINVYIEIGDSNCKGATPVPTPVSANYQGPHINTLIYAKNNLTSTDNGAWAATTQGVNEMPGYATPYNAYGDTMAFSYQLGNLLSGYKKAGIIKLGIGGSSLITSAGGDTSWNSTGGTLWAKFRDYFYSIAISKLISQNYNYSVRGVVIRLGTNDCLVNYNLAAFKSEIPILVANLRTLIADSNLPIYWIQVRSDLQDRPNPYSDPPAGSVAATRQALIDCATVGNPAYISNFTVIESNGSPSDLIADGTHFTATVYEAQGLTNATLMI